MSSYSQSKRELEQHQSDRQLLSKLASYLEIALSQASRFKQYCDVKFLFSEALWLIRKA